MDDHNDWDLFAVVRSCNNLNGNSSTQDVHDHFNGDFPSQPNDSIPSLSERSHDPGSDFPNLLTERQYFGLEEVIDRFINRKKIDKAGLRGTGKDTQAPQSTIPPPTSKPQQPLPSLQIDSSDKGGGLEDEKFHYRVKEVTAVEVPVEKVDEWDGWAWRKYGNKRACDSPHSKSYYRCSYEGNKCPAKKHVQQSQKDERKFIVTYKGQHIHPPPVQSIATKRRNSAPAPTASKRECSISPPTTNNAP